MSAGVASRENKEGRREYKGRPILDIRASDGKIEQRAKEMNVAHFLIAHQKIKNTGMASRDCEMTVTGLVGPSFGEPVPTEAVRGAADLIAATDKMRIAALPRGTCFSIELCLIPPLLRRPHTRSRAARCQISSICVAETSKVRLILCSSTPPVTRSAFELLVTGWASLVQESMFVFNVPMTIYWSPALSGEIQSRHTDQLLAKDFLRADGAEPVRRRCSEMLVGKTKQHSTRGHNATTSSARFSLGVNHPVLMALNTVLRSGFGAYLLGLPKVGAETLRHCVPGHVEISLRPRLSNVTQILDTVTYESLKSCHACHDIETDQSNQKYRWYLHGTCMDPRIASNAVYWSATVPDANAVPRHSRPCQLIRATLDDGQKQASLRAIYLRLDDSQTRARGGFKCVWIGTFGPPKSQMGCEDAEKRSEYGATLRRREVQTFLPWSKSQVLGQSDRPQNVTVPRHYRGSVLMLPTRMNGGEWR
ncbi:hypothetical protein F5148DRAFT_1147772 [Russula earlei]|uniref:Uncharacterized protein n=1 Tax=Russula earlei TaxID=71964 RepID=A0ACC0UEZ3_9AGAM|nr:hypothetical protein F5148DRAFT_1147772 [Russula earlei]